MQIKDNDAEVEGVKRDSNKAKRATLTKLKKKKQNEREVKVWVGDEELTLLYRAIGMKEYDDLLQQHPPTRKQKEDGAAYNAETFGPALVAAVCVEPALTLEDVQAIWNSDDWSRGDLAVLWENALAVNFEGFDVPFNGRG